MGATSRPPDAGQWFLKFSPAEPLASVLAVYRLSPGRSHVGDRGPISFVWMQHPRRPKPRRSPSPMPVRRRSINHDAAKAADSRPLLSCAAGVHPFTLLSNCYRPDTGVIPPQQVSYLAQRSI